MYADNKPIRSIVAITLILAVGLLCACKKTPTSPQFDETTLPVIWLNQTEVFFTATLTGGNPASQTIEIKNAGPGTLEYAIEADAGWVEVSPPTGTSAGQVNEHKISINKTGLAAKEGGHVATLTIKCATAYNNPQLVTVNLTIAKEMPPKIWIESQNFIFSSQEGGSNPSAQNLRIKNEGTGILNYQLSTDVPWLNVDPPSGSITASIKAHQILVQTAGLVSGTYTGKITVKDNNATNSPQTVNVTLNINKTAPPRIWLSTSSLAFTAIQGGADPPSKIFSVRNAGGNVLHYSIDWDAVWLVVSPSSGESNGAERNHTVTLNTGGLSAGSYQGRIVVSDPNASNTPQQIIVTLSVTNPPTDNAISISCNPSSGKKNTIVSFPVTITGNIKEIEVFGLDLTFDTSIFELNSIVRGTLTGGWTAVDGNEISAGTVRVGGFAGAANPIPISSIGSIFIVKLKVISSSSTNQQTTVRIKNYIDDIQNLIPSTVTTKFTYLK